MGFSRRFHSIGLIDFLQYRIKRYSVLTEDVISIKVYVRSCEVLVTKEAKVNAIKFERPIFEKLKKNNIFMEKLSLEILCLIYTRINLVLKIVGGLNKEQKPLLARFR